MEVDQKGKWPTGESQIRKRLNEVRWYKLLHCFCLEDEAVINKEVGNCNANPNSVIVNGDTGLAHERDVSLRQFHAQCGLV